MKPNKIFLSVIIIAIAIISFNFINPPTSVVLSPENQHPVIVELFTSQGCSSCPSADKLLHKIIDKAENENLPILGLSFHVDYWNRLGWKDVFSNKLFTDRQYEYARSFQSSSVYTPQMVVNGNQEFVGSNESKAWETIQTALKTSSLIEINISNLSKTKNQISFEYSANKSSDQFLVNAALVERNLSVDIKRGENGGRTLDHDNVVKEFQVAQLEKTGAFKMELSSISKINSSAVILYVQDAKTLEIVGATKVLLSGLI
jgi:hypothetical protein